jgi:hypothetical protein
MSWGMKQECRPLVPWFMQKPEYPSTEDASGGDISGKKKHRRARMKHAGQAFF